jgi:tRNA(adenine34) deaminase
MGLAVKEAERAAHEGEVPVGAVAVWDKALLAQGHNRSIQLHDPTAHAEIQVMRAVGTQLGNYRLNGLNLYVTVEPCAMCAGSLLWARVARLVFGTRDEKAGAVVSKASLLKPGRFNHDVEVVEGILQEECRQVIQEFFQARR